MMNLADAASMVGGRVSGGNPVFTGVSTDSRSLRSGDLFVALRGERFDGHAFPTQAKSTGASAAMVDSRHQGEFPLPVVVV
jgi:UDP-N-acetylmuramoyl-tripeptide--D-alanyl-D-alanine ligase